jgi:hypothetical protein
MNYLDDYLKTIEVQGIKDSVADVVREIFDVKLKNFDYRSKINGLLLGGVQSGKTGQMLGIIAAAADRDFDIFVIVTSDNNRLQQQTYERTFSAFTSFQICNINNTIEFRLNKMRKPVVLILKKNASVLTKWRNEILNSGFLSGTGRSIFIVDDEADAASLNTQVNRNTISTINKRLTEIRNIASSCIYLQVTATPQAVLLQAADSNFRPSFITSFKPGKNYLGGNFFFSRPNSYCIRHTQDGELKDIRDDGAEITFGLAAAALNYLIVAAQTKLDKMSKCCNFLVHPSVRIADHKEAEKKICEFLNNVLVKINKNDFEIVENLKDEWHDLFRTKPEIREFDEIFETIKDILSGQEIRFVTLNSVSDSTVDLSSGNNIIIGGNSLGRGVTIPYLQTAYYSRTAQIPQADTFWQHCRMFGYDRDRSTIRLFMPEFIHKLFQELNNSQQILINQLIENGIDNTHIVYIDGVRPTRQAVVDSSKLLLIAGGVNYFSAYPVNTAFDDLNAMLLPLDGRGITNCPLDFILEVLLHLGSEEKNDWSSKKFISAVKAIANKNNIKQAKIMVSAGRRITKGTGTMLSSADREMVDSYTEDIVLVMYQLTGEKELKWDGSPVWMPNIKLPNDFIFYKME